MTPPIGPGPGHIDNSNGPWSADVSLSVEHSPADTDYPGATVAALHLHVTNIDGHTHLNLDSIGIELTRGDLVILIDRLIDVAREAGLPVLDQIGAWGEATHSDGSIFTASPSVHAQYEEWIDIGGEA